MVSEELVQRVYSFPVDRDFLPQESLDLAQRMSTSLYPWRGQFSPGLVDLLLGAYTQEDDVVLDPFMGSGTTLFQAAGQALECHGAEINPAAVHLAGMVRFANVDGAGREILLDTACRLFDEHVGSTSQPTLFDQHAAPAVVDAAEAVRRLLRASSSDALLHNFFVTTVMLAMGNSEKPSVEGLRKAFDKNVSTVRAIPVSKRACKVYAADARNLPLPDGGMDVVITSPPYINVFNYHQNYRKAMELMGWSPLEVARSELGSNRKHRMNRFLTVIQYCMDLAEVLVELRRVLSPDGVAVFVVGRESNVRGVPFHNSRLLALIAEGGVGFQLERWQERKFTNRFGELIYEDILTLALNIDGLPNPLEFGRQVGMRTLAEALESTEGEVKADLQQALERGRSLEPSPLHRTAAG